MTGNRRILPLIKLVVSVALIVVLYRRIEIDGLKTVLKELNPVMLAPIFLLLFFNTFISSVKWHILLWADDIRIPLRPLVASYMVGSFFNVFLPSNIGGDAYRIFDVARRSSKPVNTFASVFVDRLSGFCALAVMGFVFPLAGYRLLPEAKVILPVLIVFALIVCAAAALYQQRLLRSLLRLLRIDRAPRLHKFTDQFLDSVTAYKRKPNVIAKIMAVSFLFQFTVIVCVFALSRALGLEIPFAFFCIFVPLISLMEAVPVSIYGLGLRDAGYVLFFSQLGRPAEQALSMSLLYVAINLVYASFGGIVFACRRKTEKNLNHADTEVQRNV